jgi:hypothetical protein
MHSSLKYCGTDVDGFHSDPPAIICYEDFPKGYAAKLLEFVCSRLPLWPLKGGRHGRQTVHAIPKRSNGRTHRRDEPGAD